MKTVSDLILLSTQQFGDKTVFESSSYSRLSYNELFKSVLFIQDCLNSYQIKSDDCVAILMPQGLHMTVTTLAVINTCVCVPLNPQNKKDEILFALKQNDIKAVLTLKDSEFPELFHSLIENNIPKISLPKNFLWKQELSKLPHLIERLETDNALILYTSGSTSKPKAVALTHKQLILSAKNVCNSLSLTDIDICLNVMPPFHVGAIVDLTLSPILSGGKIIVAQNSSSTLFWQYLHSYKPTWYQGVPTMLKSIVDSFDESNLPALENLRFVRSVSSKLAKDLFNKLTLELNLKVIEIYGMTEAAGVIASNQLNNNKQGSVGVSAGPEIRIIDKHGNTAKKMQQGEVLIKGQSVISSYYEFTDQNGFIGEWLKTGDLGYIDDDNYLFITGRIKELINRGGEKISPLEIDELLIQYPEIDEAAAFSMTHESLGEEVALALVCKDANNFNEEEMMEYLRQRLADFKLPRKIFYLDKLPLGAGGKLKRHELSSLAQPNTNQLESDLPKSELEQAIAKIWKNLLKVENVCLYDDFFDLGGDSLRAMELMLEIEKKLDIELSVSILLDAPTLESFCDFISKNLTLKKETNAIKKSILAPKVERKLHEFVDSWPGSRLEPSSIVIGLNTIGTATPLFYSAQSIQEITPLANYLGSDQPIYCMRSLFKVVKRGKRDYKTLAQRYLQEIIKIQPHGPYYFVAYCEGVEVIFELAQQLRKLEESVGLLAIYENHIGKKYTGRVALFHCDNGKRSPFGLFSFAKQGLKKLYGEYVSSYQYPWHHGDCFDEENFKQFSNDLKLELQLAHQNEYSPNQLEEASFDKLNPAFYQHSMKAKLPWMVKAAVQIEIKVTLNNLSQEVWYKTSRSGITLASQWRNVKGRIKQQNTGIVVLQDDIKAKQSVTFNLQIKTPQKPGLRLLEIGLREEGVDWLRKNKNITLRKWVWVR